jgi:sarcosine oxidase
MNGINEFDLIIVGMGSMGSAAAYHAAKSGLQVLGIDQYEVPHNRGSHSGQSRIVRMAYFEHPNYVPILKLAYQNWEHLKQETGESFFQKNGLLYMGNENDSLIKGVRKSADLYKLNIVETDHDQFKKDHPQFNLDHSNYKAILEPNAGYVLADRAILQYKKLALKEGAKILENTKMQNWYLEEGRVKLECEGQKFIAKKVIFTKGAWAKEDLIAVKKTLEITRQSFFYFDSDDEKTYSESQFPCWNFQDKGDACLYYGFPNSTNGLKISYHKKGEQVNPNNTNLEVSPEEQEKILIIIDRLFPKANLQLRSQENCLYTNSKDGHFIIDYLPKTKKQIIIATGFSGHGFKFVPAIGELLVNMANEGKKPGILDFLKLAR